MDYYYHPGITWTSVTITTFNCRLSPPGFIYSEPGPILHTESPDLLIQLAGFLNSKPADYLLQLFAPGMHYNQGHISTLPLAELTEDNQIIVDKSVRRLNLLTRLDWDSSENSWDFLNFSLLHPDYNQPMIKAVYSEFRLYWKKITLEMQTLEEENNRIFIKEYGLKDELKPDVPLSNITLTCNPHYRYSNNKTEEELEALLLADTMKEFISYAVGCMFGRYSLDKPGLILANQGEALEEFFAKIPEPTFYPDKDNVIPIMDADWFFDDITERFEQFLKLTFGEENYSENLKFIEDGIGKKVRKYFLKDFYNDHVKRYKKRPIYWMFSSTKGSFNALIYMHRYQSDTVSIVLNDYLREFRTKLTARKENLEKISISAETSQKEKTKSLKEIEKAKKVLDELDSYEREILYPLATKKVEIDLDDGVKINYPKFGKALKKVAGLS